MPVLKMQLRGGRSGIRDFAPVCEPGMKFGGLCAAGNGDVAYSGLVTARLHSTRDPMLMPPLFHHALVRNCKMRLRLRPDIQK